MMKFGWEICMREHVGQYASSFTTGLAVQLAEQNLSSSLIAHVVRLTVRTAFSVSPPPVQG